MAVEAEKCHAIARLHSGGAQRSGQTSYTIAKLGIGKPQIMAHHGRLAGKLLF
jgi:hypothetical protein